MINEGMNILKTKSTSVLILLSALCFISCSSTDPEIDSDKPSYGRFFGTVGGENEPGIYEQLGGYAFSYYVEADSIFEISLESNMVSKTDFSYLHFFIKGGEQISPGVYNLRNIDQVYGIDETGFSGVYKSPVLSPGRWYYSESGTLTIEEASDEGVLGNVEGVFFKKESTGPDSYTRVYTHIEAEFNLYKSDESKFFVY